MYVFMCVNVFVPAGPLHGRELHQAGLQHHGGDSVRSQDHHPQNHRVGLILVVLGLND